MNIPTEDVVDALRASLKEAKAMRRRNELLEARLYEPIAIVGTGCRYPGGVGNAEDLWRVVSDGVNTVGEVPAGRGWDLASIYDPDPDCLGATYVRHGSFLDGADLFDAGFFGISPREALMMDPQQRLILETVWEAVEHAGIDPMSLRGTRTGVYIGANGQGDTGRPNQASAESEGYLMTGISTSAISGRVSYSLGLTGPALTLDSACSASLTALHQSCQSLRSGECDLALAGGVSVMASSLVFIGLARQRALSPDGRCKAFAAGADGMGVAEGVGVVVLERLSDAVRLGHEVLAVVRGSAVNQDGASNGLTAPNGPSQERVIRAALANARLLAADVDVVEAHGTGTKLGDPIEAQAILATYGQDRRVGGEPVWLGSVKSNIGHTQAAAGVAGVIKMVQAIRHGVLPATLHVDEPTSHVDWSSGGVGLLTESRSWPVTGHPRRAAVSSFGITGTNVHLILEQAPPGKGVDDADAGVSVGADTEPSVVVPWVVSGKSAEALQAQARRLSAHIDQHRGLRPADVGLSLVSTRSVFDHRAVILGRDRADFLRGLEAVAGGEPAPDVVEGVASREPGKVVFVFPGQGSQWVGMGRELLDSSPVFAEQMNACAVALEELVEWSLMDVVCGVGGAASLDRVDVVQPVLFAMMVSLAAVWRSYGVEPDAVVGHSQGEVAAACVAGVLSLQDAARVVVVRSRLVGEVLAGAGGMASVALPVDVVESRLSRWGGRVVVAAVNGRSSVVVSGEPDALDEWVGVCEAEGVRAKRIPVNYAAHSVAVESLRDRLLIELSGITARAVEIPFYSGVTGGCVDTAGLDGDYWFRNLRDTVQFEESIRSLAEQGHGVFIEVSPHPVLAADIQDTIGDTATAVGSLRRGDGGIRRFMTEMAQVFVRGIPVDWKRRFTGIAARRVELPTYAFQHQRFWSDNDVPPGVTPTSSDEALLWQMIDREDRATLIETLDLADNSQKDALGQVLPALSAWHRRTRDMTTIQQWRYRVTWQPYRALSAATSPTGTWLLAIPAGHADHPWATALTTALTENGAHVVPVVIGRDETDRAAIAHRIRDLLAPQQAPPRAVVSLLALDERSHSHYPALSNGLVATLGLIQAHHDTSTSIPLWLTTIGAVSTAPPDLLTHPALAHIWGLGYTACLENPTAWGGLVDLPDSPTPTIVRHVVRAVADLHPEDQLAIRSTGIYCRRLEHAPEPRTRVSSWMPPGTVLVTGGTIPVVTNIARWLASNGAEHIILARDGSRPADRTDISAELVDLEVSAAVTTCDAANRHDIARLLVDVPLECPLVAVVHIADKFDDAALDCLDPQQLDAVVGPGAATVWNLHDLTREVDLSAFILLSPAAGILGGPEQAAAAAVCAFLDAFAHHRRTQGLPATSITWGPWDDMSFSGNMSEQDLLRRGIGVLPHQPAIMALQQTLEQNDTAVLVSAVDWGQLVSALFCDAVSPLLSSLPEVAATGDSADAASQPADTVEEFRTRLAGLSERDQHDLLLQRIGAILAALLNHPSSDEVASEGRFQELGVDSLIAVSLRKKLTTVTGVRLASTFSFDHPTPTALAAHLRTELTDSTATITYASAADGDAGSIGAIFKSAINQHRFADALDFLSATARTRTKYGYASESTSLPRPFYLERGDGEPMIICLNTVTPTQGQFHYTRFAAVFRGIRDVVVLSSPGFTVDEDLPETVEVLSETMATAIVDCAAGKSFVLVGHSSGGWIGHAVTSCLEARGVHPAGLVLIDTRFIDTLEIDALGGFLSIADDYWGEYYLTDYAPMSAFGHYLDIFGNWSKPALATRVLSIEATENLSAGIDDVQIPMVRYANEIRVKMAGNHFSVMVDDRLCQEVITLIENLVPGGEMTRP
ncbi:type I polyketide synthase [Nocardia sp. CA-128927]|uniref:type I polyketide synthase n=1 Tax=Nocardia sp. CA-128927 TaxID=3239975 RepID=UPI003D98892F